MSLAQITKEHDQLQARLADPTVTADPRKLQQLTKRLKQLEPELTLYQQLAAVEQEIAELETVSTDPELAAMAKADLPGHRQRLAALRQQLAAVQQPRDERDQRNVIIEIRAGAGGDEASLFARELFAMYQKYAEGRNWKVEVLSSSASEVGGYKELVAGIGGEGAFGALKFEAGTHRVQRIPATESSGRIHTSTVTVAVLPEAEEQDIAIKPEEVRVDVFRSSGPGGQSVNTTDSAVRLTHLPSGLTVSCQDEKSQHKNRAKAMTILRSRLQAAQEAAAEASRGAARRSQIGTGDRSEKIRTYNFPQDRLTDHRIKFSTHSLEKILAGDLSAVITALQAAEQASQEAA